LACGGTPSDKKVADAPIHLRVVNAPYLAFVPLHVAQAEGYFTRQGLEIEFVPMPGTEVAVPMLVDGSVDVLPGQAAPGLLNAIGRGVPIRLVGKLHDAVSGGCSSIVIVARPGLLEKAKGSGPPPIARVSLNRQAVMRYLADAAFRSVGISLDSLNVVDIPEAARPAALASGAVDATLAGEPFLTRTVRAGQGTPWIRIIDVLPDVEISLIFFGRRLIEQDPDAGTRFMVAYLQALRQLSQGKTPRNLELMAQATGDDPKLLRAACWPFGPTDGRVRMASVMSFQTWADAHGLLDRIVPAAQIWDPRFVDGAHRILDEQGLQR
jgi:NitT/TauT family transport system substrate-binding protein